MDINYELEMLIEKYNIDRHYPAYRISRQACGYLRGWVQKLADDEGEFLFIGMDKWALELIKRWGAGDNINILFIGNVNELADHAEELKMKKLYVLSFTRTIEILHWLWRNHYTAESVYDILENVHIYPQMEFYRFFTPIKASKELELFRWITDEGTSDGASIPLLEYYYQKRRLEYTTHESDIRRINEKLFFLSICMRNFLEAEKILIGMKDSGEYKQFWDEVQQLLSQIKERLYSRQQKNVVIYWLDSLSYESAKKLKYLNEKGEHSLCFHNAYTVTPWTVPTCKTMFCKNREIDDLGYLVNHINLDNSPVLRDIDVQEYQFNNLSPDFINIFERPYTPKTDIKWSDTCSEVFWNLIDQILQSERKTVFLAQVGMEIHLPALSVRRNRFDMNHNEAQIDEVDAQLRFYDDMLGNGFYRIFMSDHGYCEMASLNRVHILFQLYYSEWDGRETDKIFSLLDFDKILHQMLTGQEIEDSLWEREYAPVQGVDIYSEWFLRMIMKGKGALVNHLAYKGLVTGEYLYARFRMGKEILIDRVAVEKGVSVVLYPDIEKPNAGAAKKLGEIVGEFPKELDEDPMFKYSKYLYIVYENVKETLRKVSCLLNDKFAEYPDNSIALRMGGDHSYQIYTILTERARKKICGIIDRNANCKCKDLGIPIVRDVKELPDTIEAVVLSSFTYLDELKEEAEKYYSSLNIIDIYEYLNKCGYHFKSVFWDGIDSDWDVGFPMT